MKLIKRNRLLKFQYLSSFGDSTRGIWHEREEAFFNGENECYQELIYTIEAQLRTKGVKFEEVTNYNDTILNNFNNLSSSHEAWITTARNLKIAGIDENAAVGYKLLEVIEHSNIGEGAL